MDAATEQKEELWSEEEETLADSDVELLTLEQFSAFSADDTFASPARCTADASRTLRSTEEVGSKSYQTPSRKNEVRL